jgi:uncharacterized protein (DUF433 family)
LEVLRVAKRTTPWIVLGILLGAIVALACALFGWLCFRQQAEPFGLFLLVPSYVAVWYALRAWRLIKASTLGVWHCLVALAASLPFWLMSLGWSYREYSQLPATTPSCFVVTAAMCYPNLAMNKDVLLPNEKDPLIWVNPGRMSGAPCFYKTRLPMDSLFDNLEDGVSLDEWLHSFPIISRAQALTVLEFAKKSMLESA